MQKKYRKNNTVDKFCVYMHVFPNDKVYIGITSQQPPETRWLSGGIGYKNQLRMWRAIQKYGWDNIEHIIVARDVSAESAMNIEKDLIELYNATDKKCGYNASPGGWAMSEESKKKLSERRKGSKLSEETKQKLSKRFKGRKPPEKAVAKLIEYNRTRDYSKMVQPNETPVLQFDIANATFLNEYKSINKAAVACGADPRNIKGCTDERTTQCYGYLWIYKSKATTEYILKRLYEAQNPPFTYPIMVHDIVNDTKMYYKSQKEFYTNNRYQQKAVSYAVCKHKLFDNKYYIYRASIPDYIEATGKQYYGTTVLQNE